jgi:hypothetical protein
VCSMPYRVTCRFCDVVLGPLNKSVLTLSHHPNMSTSRPPRCAECCLGIGMCHPDEAFTSVVGNSREIKGRILQGHFVSSI